MSGPSQNYRMINGKRYYPTEWLSVVYKNKESALRGKSAWESRYENYLKVRKSFKDAGRAKNKSSIRPDLNFKLVKFTDGYRLYANQLRSQILFLQDFEGDRYIKRLHRPNVAEEIRKRRESAKSSKKGGRRTQVAPSLQIDGKSFVMHKKFTIKNQAEQELLKVRKGGYLVRFSTQDVKGITYYIIYRRVKV